MKYYKDNDIKLGKIQGSVKGVFAQANPDEPEFEISEDQAPDATFSNKGSRKLEAKDAVSILTMVIQDLEGEIRTAVAEEAEAQAEFEVQLAAAIKMKEALEGKITDLEGSIAQRNGEQEEEETTKADNTGLLQEEKKFKANIKPDCDWVLSSFTERAERRAAEMNGLVTAKAFLAGYKPSSFLEKTMPRFDDQKFGELTFRNLRA